MVSETAFISCSGSVNGSQHQQTVLSPQQYQAARQDVGFLQHDAAFDFLQIASLPKENGARGRTVVITQGALPTVVASQGKVSSWILMIALKSACFVHMWDLRLKGIVCCDVAPLMSASASGNICSVWQYLQAWTPSSRVLSVCHMLCRFALRVFVCCFSTPVKRPAGKSPHSSELAMHSAACIACCQIC